MENATIVKNLMLMQNQLRICHWQTLKYSEHKAFGEAYENLDELIDEFMEVCMGKHDRFNFEGGSCSLELFNLGDMEVMQFLDSCIAFLVSLDLMYDNKMDTDLLNLRDEMMSLLNKTKYLLTLE